MTVEFYKNRSDRKRIRKNIGDKPVLALTNVKLKDSCSVMHPVIRINRRSFAKNTQALLDVNYAYIPEMGRYYFIDDITTENDGTVSYTLTCDVLYTYKGDLLSTTVLAIRAQTMGESLYTDPEYPIRSNKIIKPIIIGYIPDEVDDLNNNFYMTVAGG